MRLNSAALYPPFAPDRNKPERKPPRVSSPSSFPRSPRAESSTAKTGAVLISHWKSSEPSRFAVVIKIGGNWNCPRFSGSVRSPVPLVSYTLLSTNKNEYSACNLFRSSWNFFLYGMISPSAGWSRPRQLGYCALSLSSILKYSEASFSHFSIYSAYWGCCLFILCLSFILKLQLLTQNHHRNVRTGQEPGTVLFSHFIGDPLRLWLAGSHH